MIKALAIKELRESAGLATLAGMGMLWMVIALTGVNPFREFSGSIASKYTLPFVSSNFKEWAVIFLGGLAVTMGLKQTAWEHGKETYYFLLWRPISRRMVMATKIVVGLLLLIGILATSIVVYGWWASVAGHAMVPFEWSMTAEAWKLALPLTLVYLGAFLSGLRPGRWFGTRLVPLAGFFYLSMLIFGSPYSWLYLPLALLGYCGAIVSIFYYAETSDY